jgi:hypothetical protein
VPICNQGVSYFSISLDYGLVLWKIELWKWMLVTGRQALSDSKCFEEINTGEWSIGRGWI